MEYLTSRCALALISGLMLLGSPLVLHGQNRETERDGPKVSKPTRRSFGTRLIEQSFVNQLKGEAQLTFEPSGVICILDIPLESLKLPS